MRTTRCILFCRHGQTFQGKLLIAIAQGIQDNACHKAWRRRVAKKLRFSFSKPRLDLILSDLRSLNDDFRTLSSQTIKSSPSQPRSIPIVPADACNDVEKYKVIGQASRQVYEALGKACTKHTEHQAHFCIEVEQVIINERHGAQVKFNMAFTHLTLTGATDQGDLIWFVVESSTGDHMTLACSGAATDCTERLTQTLKRNLDPVSEAVQKKVKKSVRFDSSVISQTCMPIPPTATLMKALSSDNNVRKDFCDFLRQRMRQQTQADVCLGVLQHTESCRNFVYPPRPRSCSQGRQVTSLGRLISSMTKHKDVGRFSLYDRIHLAKMLAIAVLQYHATPWLRASWRSDDVYFFGTDDSPSTQHLLDLSSPHLNVKVKGPDGQLSRASTFPPHTLARNPLLFSLGVVLLELAHTSTLESLQRPIDLEDGHENRYTEFFLARRLAKLRSSDMGINYHKVVERLVECDFGCGTDLSEPQLQTAFYKDVIYPLESLQKKLHDFHLDC